MRSYYPRSALSWVLIGVALALLYGLVNFAITPTNKLSIGHHNVDPATAHTGIPGSPTEWLESPETAREPLPKLRLKTKHLKAFRGQTAKTPIYIAVRGFIYDVSPGRGFYGPGGAYFAFAGTDATLGLAKGRLDLAGEVANIEEFTKKDLASLEDWEGRFKEKYKIVGLLEG